MSPEICAWVVSGCRLISLVGPLLFLGFTTTRKPVSPVRPVRWLSWPGTPQCMVKEVGPTWENCRLMGGEMPGWRREKQNWFTFYHLHHIINSKHLLYNWFLSLPVACFPTTGVLALPSCRAMTFTVYSVPGCRPRMTADSASPRGAGSSSLSPSSELEYRTRYDVTIPSGVSQVSRSEVESMSEKVRSLGRSTSNSETKQK